MPSLLIVEAPGGMGEQFQCPYCSRMYHVLDPEDGKTKLEPPRACRRCASPMDVEKAQEFQDTQAALPPKPAGSRVVRKV